MPSQTGNAAFANAISGFYKDTQFSDLKIECEGHEFNVHKLILANHSPVFKTLLTGKWKEAKESVINIRDSCLHVVDAMVYFMYHFNYEGGEHVSSRPSKIIFHAQMYSIGDLYDMAALREHAKDLFKAAIQEGWNTDDFFEAVEEAYTATPSSNRDLRDLIVEVCQRNAKQLCVKADFKKALESTSGLAVDLVAMLVSGSKYRCSTCSAIATWSPPPSRTPACCGHNMVWVSS